MKRLDLFGNPSENINLEQTHDAESGFELFPVALEDAAVEDELPTPRRFPGFIAALAIIIPALVIQCYHLQVSNASINRSLAEGNSVRVSTTPADRGLVVDINGVNLAQNDRQVGLALNPQTFPRKKADRQVVYNLLLKHGAITQEQIAFLEQDRLQNAELYPLKMNLSKEDSLLYREWFADTPGIVLTELPERNYADVASLGQLMGYVGAVSDADVKAGAALNQRVGKTGLEEVYNQQLSGIPGRQLEEVDAQGTVIRTVGDRSNTKPTTGDTLKLNIDSKLQQAVAEALKEELARRTVKYGPLPKLGAAAVVIDPRDGSIRAMVSLPDYSSNTFSQGVSSANYANLINDPGDPLINRAIQGVASPGSTIKPLVAAAGLQEGVIGADTSFVTPAAITVGPYNFPDWKVHGLTNTRKALAESNNIFFYTVGGGWDQVNIKGLGITRLNNYLNKFGLGKKTGVDLPGESAGLIPDDAWKRAQTGEGWYIGDTYHSSIGQGFILTTPLQMAMATAAVANGGTVYTPHVAHSLIDSTGAEHPIAPVVLDQNFVSPQNLQVVREGMRQAVTSGSARFLNGLNVASAGKTGTAQFGNQGLTHAWYTGFAPYDNPTMAFAILIEGGGESFYSSVPVAEGILRAFFNQPLQPGEKLLSEPSDATVAAIAAEYAGER